MILILSLFRNNYRDDHVDKNAKSSENVVAGNCVIALKDKYCLYSRHFLNNNNIRCDHIQTRNDINIDYE